MSHQPKKLIKDIDPTEVQKFKQSFDTATNVLTEGDEGYEKSIARWGDNAVRKAGIVVQPTSLDDIVKTVKFASQHNLDFAVCCGGHSTSGSSSSEGGVVLDMRKLNQVRVDVDNKLIYAQGGALFGEVDNEAWKYGLATVGGIVDHTGVGGLTLGGGYGHLSGKHGLTVDNVMGATIVTADGEVRELSESKNEDLFWAIRGCGHNFGVVYEFTFKAHEQKEIFVGVLAFTPDKLDSLVEAFNLWLKNRGPYEDGIFSICRMPPEYKPTIATLLFSDDPSEQVFRERFSLMLKCEPVMEQLNCVPYPQVNSILNQFVIPGGSRRGVLNAQIANPKISNVREVYDSFVKFTEENPTAATSFVSYEFPGTVKYSTVSPNAMAFYSRKPIGNVVIIQDWKNEQDDKIVYDWAKGIQKIASRDCHDDQTLYVNFDSTTDKSEDYTSDKKMKLLFGENLEKLKELKRKYDPNVFFRKGAVIWP